MFLHETLVVLLKVIIGKLEKVEKFTPKQEEENFTPKARFVLLVVLRDFFFRFRVGGMEKKKKKL